MVYAHSMARHGLLWATALLLGAARLIAARRNAVVRKAAVRVCFDAKRFVICPRPAPPRACPTLDRGSGSCTIIVARQGNRLSLPGLTRQSIPLQKTSCEEDGPAGQARG